MSSTVSNHKKTSQFEVLENIARLASTHTALVSQSLVGLCFAFPLINQISFGRVG